jgi:hypothetical protein
MKIRPMGAEFSKRTDKRTDGRMDEREEANTRFSQFCERAYEN